MKRVVIILLAAFLLAAVTGCQRETEAQTSISITAADAAAEAEETPTVYNVILRRDEDALLQMAENLIISRYEEYVYDDEVFQQWQVQTGEKLVASLDCSSDWMVSYTDYENDCNGTHMEDDYMITYGYITDTIPNGLDFTAEEAGEQLCNFLEQYVSVFTFQTYRVLAENQEDETQPGYYSAFAQALYKGIPLVLDANSGENHIWAYANIGPNGIFSLDGTFLLREVSRVEVDVVSQETVREHLLENYAAITGASDVDIDSIELEYFVDTEDDGYYSMFPVWAFSGTLTFANDDGTTYSMQASILYYADTGTLCDVYYPGP
ncbi:MAG: hypothetical protein LUE21_00535 [Oscillospiraceae bacterium]|nr:hypothetical protein [Oscillospiraceae bacterium]